VNVADELEARLRASIERAARLARGGARASARGARGADANRLWLAQGQSADVHGYATGDFVYAGSGLRALDHHDAEPSLIDPALPIDPAHANTAGDGVDYWLSYSDLSAASRTACLQWLHGGRKDPHAAAGYVRLFVYGLERRIYEYVKRLGSSGDEALAIAYEAARLLDLYGPRSNTLASAVQELLDLIALIEPRSRAIRRRAGAPGSYRVSTRLRIALGERAAAGQPVPAKLAYEWLGAMRSPSTAARRCTREFELLFHIRYAKQFGEGFLVKPNKTFIELTYSPASPGLGVLTVKQRQLPDVMQLTRPLAKLEALSDECTSALTPFSRFLLKNGRESLAAFALLPEELVEATHSADATSIADLIRSRIDREGFARVIADEVLQYIRVARPEKIARSEAMLLAQALEKLGYAIEPDVRMGGPAFQLGTPVVVFRRLPDCPSTASEEYATATLCLRLGAIVSAADDEVSQSERALLQKHIADTLQLSAGERQRLAAHLAWLLEARPGTSGVKKQLAALTSDKRHHVGQLLITVAASDGRVDPREMRMLEKLYDLIGLEASDLYADIHAALAGDDEPVAVAPPVAAQKGFAIPRKPAAATPAGIDMDRVRLKIAETREVSTLLSSIFAEDDAPVAVAPEIAQTNSIGTLDPAHSALLRRLAERESWPREDVERLAAELSLLPDGALETINDYAYTAAADAFWEDHDPVTINSHVARELIV
jgi:uncharacterized tellurite resistance protein B-like protein